MPSVPDVNDSAPMHLPCHEVLVHTRRTHILRIGERNEVTDWLSVPRRGPIHVEHRYPSEMLRERSHEQEFHPILRRCLNINGLFQILPVVQTQEQRSITTVS